MSIEDNLTNSTKLIDTLTGGLFVACESRVSIQENLTDRTNLSGLLVACESRVSTEKYLTDRTNLSDILTGVFLVACKSWV